MIKKEQFNLLICNVELWVLWFRMNSSRCYKEKINNCHSSPCYLTREIEIADSCEIRLDSQGIF